MPLPQSLALTLAASLLWSSAASRPTALGVVMKAKRVHLNSVAVTAGATVYDGDRFYTEAGGSLHVRGDMAMIELAEASAVSLRNPSNVAHGIELELVKGTLVFSAAQTLSLNVIARDTSIRPSTNTRTVAQISITGLRELRVYARRGGLQLSYRGETETLS